MRTILVAQASLPSFSDEPERDEPHVFDRLCLSLGFLTNLVQDTVEARDRLRTSCKHDLLILRLLTCFYRRH